MQSNKKNNISGYTMIELLMAVVVGSIVLAGAYSSYNVVATQFDKNRSTSEILSMAIPTLDILTRDLRMAGSKYIDADIESTWGRIDDPIIINNTAGNFDSLSIVYDREVEDPASGDIEIVRTRKTYYIDQRNDPTRNAIYMDIDIWDGAGWVADQESMLLADYITSFKVAGEKNNSRGQPTLVHINIIFQSRNKHKSPENFIKSSYGTGDNVIDITDNYRREEFETSVFLRNLANF